MARPTTPAIAANRKDGAKALGTAALVGVLEAAAVSEAEVVGVRVTPKAPVELELVVARLVLEEVEFAEAEELRLQGEYDQRSAGKGRIKRTSRKKTTWRWISE